MHCEWIAVSFPRILFGRSVACGRPEGTNRRFIR